jgi:hypothetical protein
MVKALELTRQMLFGIALALLVASTFLILQHQVLGDTSGGERTCPINCNRCGSPQELPDGTRLCMGQDGKAATCQPPNTEGCVYCLPCKFWAEILLDEKGTIIITYYCYCPVRVRL